jgi:flagellar biosynthesis protein FlhF
MEAKPMEEKPSEMPKEELKEEIKEENKEEIKEERPNTLTAEAFDFVRILYKQLIDNEVNEKYANQILEEVEQFIRPGASVDMILANVYQKLILRFGRPEPLEVEKGKTKVVFFIGPTGVGKTTTIAKIASRFKVEQNDPIAFITSDTYRIAAPEQLRVYANILDVPMSVVYSAEELNDTLDKMRDYALVFVDTAGFSHRNEAQREDISKLIKNLDPEWDKEVYLVVSATTKYRDLLDIADIYSEISDYKLIFTKLDETSAYGNLLNIKLYSGAELSYMTTGQNVPDDIELFNIQKIVKQILGGR